MTINATEIEAIVRKVLATLIATDPTVASEVIVNENVITIANLRGKLDGKSTLRVPSRSIITPAVIDLCRDANVKIIKGDVATAHATTSNLGNASTPVQVVPSQKPQRLIMAGSSAVMQGIAKQMCPKQAKVLGAAHDDTSALREVANGLRNGHQAGVLLVKSAYSTCWQAARDEMLRPVVLSQWTDMSAAFKEVPTNVLILPQEKWNVAATCNAARHFFEHLRNAS